MSGDVYSRLVEAGAPEIAEPRFYRIKHNAEGSGLTVQIRERNRRGGSRALARTQVWSGSDPALQRVVEALQDLHASLQVMSDEEALVGDHP